MRERIEVDGLILRRVDLLDVDRILAAVQESRPELGRWMPWATEGYGRKEAGWFVATAWLGWDAGTSYEMVVEDADDGRLLGLCGLNQIAGRAANLGYWVRTSETGHGVCTRAARAVARFGFEDAGLRRLRLFHAAENIGSQRVAEKIGFIREGRRRAHIVVNGDALDTVLYSLVDLSEVR